MKRSAALVVALVILTLLAGCGSNGPSTLNDAATIRYALKGKQHTLHVSRAQLLREVRELVVNKPFRQYLKDQNFEINNDLTASSQLTAIWLTQLIQQEAIDDLFAARHLHVSATDRDKATSDATQFFPNGETIFPAFTKKFQSELIERKARTEALLASYIDTSDSAARAYFAAHRSTFGCASGKNVAHILVKTQTAAQGLLDQVRGGASFGTLARENSTDPGSAQQDGSLGCLKPGEFVTAFQSAAQTAPIGTPIGPVHTEFGYHVILVTAAAEPTYESARTDVIQALQQKGQQDFADAVSARIKSLKVHLNPRFGTWGPVTGAQGRQQYVVTPPKAPEPATSRDGTTTTTGAPNGSP